MPIKITSKKGNIQTLSHTHTNMFLPLNMPSGYAGIFAGYFLYILVKECPKNGASERPFEWEKSSAKNLR